MDSQWKPGNFYVLEGKPDAPGDPVLQAVITQPGPDSAIELVVKIADIPLIGAPFNEDEMEKAKSAGEMIVARFWPSDEALSAMIKVVVEAEGLGDPGDAREEEL